MIFKQQHSKPFPFSRLRSGKEEECGAEPEPSSDLSSDELEGASAPKRSRLEEDAGYKVPVPSGPLVLSSYEASLFAFFFAFCNYAEAEAKEKRKKSDACG